MTKKVLLASIGLGLALVSATPALAAGPWTGIYLGAHAGGVWGDIDTAQTAQLDGGFPFNGQLVGEEHDLSPNGVLGGAQIGYLYQMSNIVLGVEVSGSFSDLDETELDPNDTDNARTVNSDWNAAATLRAGYAFGNSLAYVKGGYAMAEFDVDLVNLNPGGDSFSTSERHDGWTAGAGYEHQLSSDVSFAIEYAYYDLGSQDHTAVDLPDSETHEVGATLHSVTARLNWHFNP